ncbi:MAG: STELLO glycosyltransferase family protein [Cytophagales bacterium]|nr:STELLO glycosyltransferase family protein [Cytophagales bacterium]
MKFIVITSIFPPTKAVNVVNELPDCHLLVIGDVKTPAGWELHGADFISFDEQINLPYTITGLLPVNHYARKNIGYIHAIKCGAQTIIDTDDDNIPYADWHFPDFEGEYPMLKSRNGFVNIYSHYTDQKIWPRGLPLNLINSQEIKIKPEDLVRSASKIGVWQGLVDLEPDLDAIYRLVYNIPCSFEKKGELVLSENTISPFNSQNTVFRKELFPLLYLPSTVTMRFSDILRGFVAQPIMWLLGYKLGINQATVYQERNIHDFIRDFEEEIPCYLQGEKTIETVKNAICPDYSLTENLYRAYEALYKNEIVEYDELSVLTAWINDISQH